MVTRHTRPPNQIPCPRCNLKNNRQIAVMSALVAVPVTIHMRYSEQLAE